MFAWKNTAWDATSASGAALPKLDAWTTGMVAGTKVATRNGWTAIEKIQPGQDVLTFDGGLQRVVSVTRHVLMADYDETTSWPLNVPAGALGNLENMTILPHQAVLVESDLAEALTGDPFALIPSAALEGYRGITCDRPAEWVEVIQLHFEQDEIVFANIGALFLCRAEADLLHDANDTDYDVLSLSLADDLVDCLMSETNTDGPVATHAPMTAGHAA